MFAIQTTNVLMNGVIVMFYCVMYSGVECVCGVTLSVYLKNLPDHGGNQTCNIWFASPMLCQLDYKVKLV